MTDFLLPKIRHRTKVFLFYSKYCRARGGLGSLLPCDMSRSVEREDGGEVGAPVSLLWNGPTLGPTAQATKLLTFMLSHVGSSTAVESILKDAKIHI